MLTGSTQVMDCRGCPAGSYAYPAGQTACTTCPLDSYCATTSAAPTACPAATPYTVTTGSTALSQCQANLYSPCRAGFFVFPVNNPDKQCTRCERATYCVNDIITACSPYANTLWYAPAKASDASECVFQSITGTVTCPAGTVATPNVAMTHVWQCRASAGYYFIPGIHTVGQTCPVGYYCLQAALVPIACVAGTCSTLGSQTLAVQCPAGVSAQLAACQVCSPGLAANAVYKVAGACDICCNAGYYMSAANTCTVVPDSKTCVSSTTYMPDPPGTTCAIISAPACVACPTLAGGVVLTRNQTYRLQNARRMWGTDACVYVCPTQGYALVSGVCTACSAGTYQVS